MPRSQKLEHRCHNDKTHMEAIEWQARLRNIPTNFDPLTSIEVLHDLITENHDISSWADFQQWFSPFKSTGCFRGQRKFEWTLETTFDRAIYRTYSYKHGSATGNVNAERNENFLIREFQRAAHLYHRNLPGPDALHEWLALMQHHGCPTRLLDWTHSPYVALYFAVYEPSEEDGALWALNLNWAEEVSNHFKQDWNALTDAEKQTKISPRIVRPSISRLNERMVTQRGELLSTSSYSVPFALTLLALILRDKGRLDRNPVLSRVKISKAKRLEFLDELNRMNIHHASLFPGPDGFSKSLSLSLELEVKSQIEELIKSANELVEETPNSVG